MFVFLKCVERSRRLVSLNLGPLKMFRSRNSTCDSDTLHVNLSVWCALFSLSRKLSSSSLVPGQMQRMSSM